MGRGTRYTDRQNQPGDKAMRTHIGKKKIGRFGGALALGASLTLGACDLEVTNPGPVADTSLNDDAAFQATLNGAIRTFSDAINEIGVDVSIRTREFNPTALNDWYYVEVNGWSGEGDVENVVGFNTAHDARWMADDAVRRLTEVLGSGASSNGIVAQAHLWGGYIHRLMGEYFCEAVYDGGPALPGTDYLDRAETRFTSAIEVGTAAGLSDVVTAATAGRASVRVDLGDWAGAVADAATVSTDFSWGVPYFGGGDWRLYNAFYFYSAPESSAQIFTVWNTLTEGYYTATDDPRTPWVADPDKEFGSGSLQPWGQVPWWRPTKYAGIDSPIELSSGEEMRLIEAEDMLRGGDMAGAMVLINDLRERALAGLGNPAPADMDEAWAFLKRERGIELWLEGRRLADLARWRADSTPGALDPLELGLVARDGFIGPDLTTADLCMPISNTEREENENLDVL